MFNDLINNLNGFFRALSTYKWWQVAIELLLIGLVVYWVLRFLRGTRGAKMLQGIAFVLIVGYLIVRLLASAFELDRIAFLYEKFLLGAGFAITVAFQPELRRALMRIGEAPIFGIRGRRQIDEEIDALVEAATFLSRRKIGAVIAIERETGWGAWRRTAPSSMPPSPPTCWTRFSGPTPRCTIWAW
jgi:diadenylate cyclase